MGTLELALALATQVVKAWNEMDGTQRTTIVQRCLDDQAAFRAGWDQFIALFPKP